MFLESIQKLKIADTLRLITQNCIRNGYSLNGFCYTYKGYRWEVTKVESMPIYNTIEIPSSSKNHLERVVSL